MTLDEMKAYDVIFFGTWDENGRCVLGESAVSRVSDYIDLGYGVFLGHNTVGYRYGNSVSLGMNADKFGIILGTQECTSGFVNFCSNGTINAEWYYYSNEIIVKKQ